MKYAKEVIDLLAAYPGRRFKMRQILNHVHDGAAATAGKRHASRIGVYRVLQHLIASGQVEQHKAGETSAAYCWRQLIHEGGENCYRNCHNTGRSIAP